MPKTTVMTTKDYDDTVKQISASVEIVKALRLHADKISDKAFIGQYLIEASYLINDHTNTIVDKIKAICDLTDGSAEKFENSENFRQLYEEVLSCFILNQNTPK